MADLSTPEGKLVEELKELGVVRSTWPKDAGIYFSHTSGHTDMVTVREFFDKAVKLCEEAADALSRIAAERDEARQALEDAIGPRLRELHYGDGEFSAQITGKAVEAMALAFVSQFKEGGAKNFMEMNIFDRDEPFQRYTVTVQKVGALSPADKLNAAERERDELKAQQEELIAGFDRLGAAQNEIVHKITRERDELKAEVERLREALKQAHATLELMISPAAIKNTSVQTAWALAVEAEAKARAALAEKGATT